MPTKPEAAARSNASFEDKVRIESVYEGKDHWHETATEVFRKSIDVELRAEIVKLKMGVVRIIMSRQMARDLVRKILSFLEPEDQWAIIEPLAEDLERRGIFRPR